MKKKRVLAFFIVLFCCACLFANGEKESQVSKKTSGQYSSVGLIGRTIQGIGSTYGIATRAVVLALHPFPNILTKFYGFVDGELASTYEGDFDSDWMLTNENFYTNSGYTSTGANDNFTGQAKVEMQGSKSSFSISETDVSNGTLQKTRWTVTSYLFIVFFAAEVVFTAVFGYIAPQDENASLLRQIGVSAAMTLMLFILAAALPFLVEAVRYGLFQIANLYTPVTFNSMFDMPKKFMWDMSYLMEQLSWRDDASPIFNEEKGSLSSSILGKLLAGIIYVIFEFVMGLQVIKAGLHIVVNIIEIYLLLSVVMIMLPISVFTPLKGVTRKSVYSLFANLLECFVLCFIIVLVVPACVAGTSNLKAFQETLSNLLNNYLELVATEDLTFSTGETVETTWRLVFEAQGSDYVTVVYWSTPDETGQMVMYQDDSSELYQTYKSNSSNITNGSSFSTKWTETKYDYYENKKPSQYKYDDRVEYFKYRANYMLGAVRAFSNNTLFTDIAEKREADRKEETGTLYPEVSTCIQYVKNSKSFIMNTEYPTEANTSYAKNSTTISGLLIAWVFLYLPCFFVMQSTQVTNALSNGSAGHESFANAFSHTGQNMLQAATMMTNMIKSGVSMAASGTSAATQSSIAQDVSSMAEKMQNMNNKDSGGQG